MFNNDSSIFYRTLSNPMTSRLNFHRNTTHRRSVSRNSRPVESKSRSRSRTPSPHRRSSQLRHGRSRSPRNNHRGSRSNISTSDQTHRSTNRRAQSPLPQRGSHNQSKAKAAAVRVIVEKKYLDPHVPLSKDDILDQRYLVEKLLGSGGFASVFRCFDQKYQEHVALKIFHQYPYSHQWAQSEIEIMKYITDTIPNQRSWVVMYNSSKIQLHNQSWIIICTPCLGQSLYDYSLQHTALVPFKGFAVEMIRCILFQVCVALTGTMINHNFSHQHNGVDEIIGLHKLDLVHRDIKPENIMLCNPTILAEQPVDRRRIPKDLEIRLVDFGSACKRNNSKCIRNELPVTPPYRAPEQLLELESDTPVDMWSVGCLAAELYTGTALFPFHHDQHIEQMRAIQEVLNHRLVMSEIKSATKSVHPLPPKSLPLQDVIYDGELLDFIRHCLIIDPTKRITAMAALQHYFLSPVSTTPLAIQVLEPLNKFIHQ